MGEAVTEDSELSVKPYSSLQEVWQWEAANANYLLVPHVTLNARKRASPSGTNRTLVCHDMMGGYLDDRFVQGSNRSSSYRFVHWSKIDLFVYFSHSFVTIPPPSWTDAAHLHGVPMLGTVITENVDGMALCGELFDGQDPYIIINFIQKLVALAQFYKFDGWLINIENPIEPDHVQHLRNFLDWLTIKMHAAIPGSIVLWYDSVTEEGQLKWQNELNIKNKMFFDACDGIYLNYNWNREKLEASAKVAGEDRVDDVFAGVDVFGRGTLGGGGFNSQEAMKVIHEVGLSTAIFAQGWVYEVLGEDNFIENDHKFWNLLNDFTPTNGPSFLPFATSFCQGYGNEMYRQGERKQSVPWSNQSLQQYQVTDYSTDDAVRTRVCTDLSYNGGGCLEILGTVRRGEKHSVRLFASWFEARVTLLCTYSYMSTFSNAIVDLILDVKDVNGMERVWMLTDSDDVDLVSRPVKLIRPAEPQVLLELDQMGLRVPSEPQNGWITKCHILSPEDVEAWIAKVSIQISVPTELSEDVYRIMLGQIQLVPLQLLLDRPELEVSCTHVATERTATTLHVSGVVSWSGGAHQQLLNCFDLHCRLTWHDRTGAESQDHVIETRFVGATRRHVYKINALPFSLDSVPEGERSSDAFTLRFIVCEQLVGFGGCEVPNGAYADFEFS